MQVKTKTKQTKKTLPVLHGGAGRGARCTLEAIKRFNDCSISKQLLPIYTDPVPDKALACVRDATRIGLEARAVEAKIEKEVAAAGPNDVEPLFLAVDHPRVIAECLHASVGKKRPIVGFILIRTPDESLMGLRFAIAPGDDAEKRRGTRLFEAFAEITARTGSEVVVGEAGLLEHALAEPAYRRWYAEFLNEAIGKIVADLPMNGFPFEVTLDGTKTLPLIIWESTKAWAKPQPLAEAVVKHYPLAVLVGQEAMIAETGPGGVRFHPFRRRKSDGRVSLHDTVVPEAADLVDPTDRSARKEAKARLERIERRAARTSASRRAPMMMTD